MQILDENTDISVMSVGCLRENLGQHHFEAYLGAVLGKRMQDDEELDEVQETNKTPDQGRPPMVRCFLFCNQKMGCMNQRRLDLFAKSP